jgi:spore coat protein CotF
MNEKVLVSDSLNAINGCLTRYGEMISQTENQQLRQTLQQMRNETETSQYELFTLAKSKAYYQPAQKATQDEVTNVKSLFSSGAAQSSAGGSAGSSSSAR